MRISNRSALILIGITLCAMVLVPLSIAQTLPGETPQTFTPTKAGFEYTRREMMIPMRDGVKLHTVVLAPNGAKNAPMLLTRTPYNATALTSHAASTHLGPILNGYDNATEV